MYREPRLPRVRACLVCQVASRRLLLCPLLAWKSARLAYTNCTETDGAAQSLGEDGLRSRLAGLCGTWFQCLATLSARPTPRWISGTPVASFAAYNGARFLRDFCGTLAPKTQTRDRLCNERPASDCSNISYLRFTET